MPTLALFKLLTPVLNLFNPPTFCFSNAKRALLDTLLYPCDLNAMSKLFNASLVSA